MEALTENWDLILKGFWETIKLLLVSGGHRPGDRHARRRRAGAARWPILRRAAVGYVTLFRNTPLLVLIILTYYGLPEIGIDFGFFVMITMAMGVYTAAFVAECIRSGVNGIGLGQAEAARSIGMPFGMTMTQVILPQAFRFVVPPLASVFIALTKNTSLAARLRHRRGDVPVEGPAQRLRHRPHRDLPRHRPRLHHHRRADLVRWRTASNDDGRCRR